MLNMLSMGIAMSIKVHTEENEDILGTTEQPTISELFVKLFKRKRPQSEEEQGDLA